MAFLNPTGYSPVRFFRIFKAVPVGTSLACLGTYSLFPVDGLDHLSCRLPCLAKMHPASIRRFNNSDFFIMIKSSFVIKTPQR